MKKLILILSLLFFAGFFAYSQTDSQKTTRIADTQKRAVDTQRKVTDTAKPAILPIIKKAVKKIVIANTAKTGKAADSLKRHDSLTKPGSQVSVAADTNKALPPDSAKRIVHKPVTKNFVDSIYLKLLNNPFINTKGKPVYLVIQEHERQSKDEIFYLLSGLLLFLAFIKLVFKKYFRNIFRLFLQPSFRQKHTNEQVSQNNLPSLLLNLFFIFSAAVYVSFLLQHYHLTHFGFLLLLLYLTACLLILYVGKFVLLTFLGWVFGVKEAAHAYMFAVYLINKILGVILIPFTLLIAFSQPYIIDISITISLLIILLLYLYRYLVSYAPVRKEVSVSLLHFFLYIFAFEIVPLLVIYKTLIIYMDNSL